MQLGKNMDFKNYKFCPQVSSKLIAMKQERLLTPAAILVDILFSYIQPANM